MLLAAQLPVDAATWPQRYGLTGGVTLSDAGGGSFVGPTVLAMTGPGSTLVRESFTVRGKQLIAVTHPSCHFLANALSAIFSDAVLRGRLRGKMTLLTLQQSEADLSDFKQWSSAHPQDQFKMAFAMADWPMLTSWDTPIFYFLHDGVVVDQVHSWPRDSDNLVALRLALDRLERR